MASRRGLGAEEIQKQLDRLLAAAAAEAAAVAAAAVAASFH